VLYSSVRLCTSDLPNPVLIVHNHSIFSDTAGYTRPLSGGSSNLTTPLKHEFLLTDLRPHYIQTKYKIYMRKLVFVNSNSHREHINALRGRNATLLCIFIYVVHVRSFRHGEKIDFEILKDLTYLSSLKKKVFLV
jgi:hypothetical protein